MPTKVPSRLSAYRVACDEVVVAHARISHWRHQLSLPRAALIPTTSSLQVDYDRELQTAKLHYAETLRSRRTARWAVLLGHPVQACTIWLRAWIQDPPI